MAKAPSSNAGFARGEPYVVIQFLLFALVIAGPRTIEGWPGWPPAADGPARAAGAVLMALGGLLVLTGAASLGRHISALPHPVDGSPLRETGVFRLVRHPMYGGAVIAALGLAAWTAGWLTLAYALLLFALFELKARREEGQLLRRYPGYADYRRRVRKLIPFIY